MQKIFFYDYIGFKILAQTLAVLFPRFKLGTVNQFGFESLEKTFSHDVITSVLFHTHALPDIVVPRLSKVCIHAYCAFLSE